MNSQMNTKHSKARPNKKTAKNAGNISAMKRNQNIYVVTFLQFRFL